VIWVLWCHRYFIWFGLCFALELSWHLMSCFEGLIYLHLLCHFFWMMMSPPYIFWLLLALFQMCCPYLAYTSTRRWHLLQFCESVDLNWLQLSGQSLEKLIYKFSDFIIQSSVWSPCISILKILDSTWFCLEDFPLQVSVLWSFTLVARAHHAQSYVSRLWHECRPLYCWRVTWLTLRRLWFAIDTQISLWCSTHQNVAFGQLDPPSDKSISNLGL
jgi:hypothetical protein